MKKLIVLALLATLACGAYASSLAVPWFSDFEGTSIGGDWGVRSSTYVTLKNNTTDDLLCEIVYTDAKGNDMTPLANTFLIGGSAAIGFRPVVDDLTEAPNASVNPGPAYLVPNAAADQTSGNDPLPAGSATVSWVGGVKDVQGMVTLTDLSMDSNSAYLLPEGE